MHPGSSRSSGQNPHPNHSKLRRIPSQATRRVYSASLSPHSQLRVSLALPKQRSLDSPGLASQHNLQQKRRTKVRQMEVPPNHSRALVWDSLLTPSHPRPLLRLCLVVCHHRPPNQHHHLSPNPLLQQLPLRHSQPLLSVGTERRLRPPQQPLRALPPNPPNRCSVVLVLHRPHSLKQQRPRPLPAFSVSQQAQALQQVVPPQHLVKLAQASSRV